ASSSSATTAPSVPTAACSAPSAAPISSSSATTTSSAPPRRLSPPAACGLGLFRFLGGGEVRVVPLEVERLLVEAPRPALGLGVGGLVVRGEHDLARPRRLEEPAQGQGGRGQERVAGDLAEAGHGAKRAPLLGADQEQVGRPGRREGPEVALLL